MKKIVSIVAAMLITAVVARADQPTSKSDDKAGVTSDEKTVSVAVPRAFVPGSRELPRFNQKAAPKEVTDQDKKKAEAEKARKALAEARYKEMLDKMRVSVEEIAQLYGNPLFVQLFTNDHQLATEFEKRLASTATVADLRSEIAELEKQRDELRKDLALLEQEKQNQAARLIKQRGALDAVDKAVGKAQKAIEDSAP